MWAGWLGVPRALRGCGLKAPGSHPAPSLALTLPRPQIAELAQTAQREAQDMLTHAQTELGSMQQQVANIAQQLTAAQQGEREVGGAAGAHVARPSGGGGVRG